jgi:opacity protein-like surface antigen
MKIIFPILLLIGMGFSVFAVEEEKKPSRITPYLTAKITGGWMNSSTATIYDPPAFEGQGTFDFSAGVTLLLGGGLRFNTQRYSYGLEVEWYSHQFDITDAPEPYNDFPYIQTDTWAFNGIIGMNKYQRYKPYILAGMTYNQASLYETPNLMFYEEGLHSDDTVVGCQLGVGIIIINPEPKYKKFNLDIGGRYFQTADLTFKTGDRSIEIQNSGYMIHFGLTYNFSQ